MLARWVFSLVRADPYVSRCEIGQCCKHRVQMNGGMSTGVIESPGTTDRDDVDENAQMEVTYEAFPK